MVKIIYLSRWIYKFTLLLIYNWRTISKVGIYLFIKMVIMIVILISSTIFVNIVIELKNNRVQSDLSRKFSESLCEYIFRIFFKIFIYSYSVFDIITVLAIPVFSVLLNKFQCLNCHRIKVIYYFNFSLKW